MKKPKSEDYEYGDAYEIALEQFIRHQEDIIKKTSEK